MRTTKGAVSIGLVAAMLVQPLSSARAQRQMERLGRGLVALRQSDEAVFIGWRLLGTDPDDLAFNVYRSSAGGEPIKLNEVPLKGATHHVDRGAQPGEAHTYSVRPVLRAAELEPSAPFVLEADTPPLPYLSVPLQTPDGYQPNDASVGDLDGEYEIVLHQVGRGRDNSQRGRTTEPILEAYRLDGTLLWRINLGKNIREGAHYTQFMVYDLDGDGRAELACKTADGTVDGRGKVIGDATADHRNERGYVLDGPEVLTVFDGETGAALATTHYVPPRGDVRSCASSRTSGSRSNTTWPRTGTAASISAVCTRPRSSTATVRCRESTDRAPSSGA